MRPVRTEEGFSLLEVLFASFIAFFILSALFGVLVMSASEGRISKVDTIATNLGQLCVEQARSLTYEQVGIQNAPSGQVSGSLESSETTSFQGISFRVRREVVWVADPVNAGGTGQDYKQLTVLVNDWKAPRVTRVVTYIRDTKNESLPGPRVEFTTKPELVKPPNPVVFVGKSGGYAGMSLVWDGTGTLDSNSRGIPSIQCSASVDATSGTIVRIEFQVGNVVIGDPWTGTPTRWVAKYPSPDAMPINLSQESTAGPVFVEGMNVIKAVATANNLGVGTDMIILTLDNTAGTFSAGNALTTTPPQKNADVYRGGMTLNWPVPRDGNEAVPYYDLGIVPYGSSGTTLSSVALGDSGTYVLGPPAPSSVATLNPFGVYTFRLLTRSIRGLSGNALVTGRVLTPPRCDATVENQAPDKKTADTFVINLAVTAPPSTAQLIGLLGSGAYTIYYDVYSMPASTYTYPGMGDLPSGAYLETSGKQRVIGQVGPTPITFAPKDNDPNKYFQVEARIVGGFPATTRLRIRGNVVGPQPASGPPTYLTTKIMPIPGVTP